MPNKYKYQSLLAENYDLRGCVNYSVYLEEECWSSLLNVGGGVLEFATSTFVLHFASKMRRGAARCGKLLPL